MKVVITNAVALNGGDAAILLGVVKLLRAAFGEDTRFVVFDSQPEAAQRHYPELEFRELWYMRATRRAGRFLRKPRRAFHLARVRLAAAWNKRGWRAAADLLLDAEERRAMEECSSADLFVSTGGTYLVENYPLKPRLFEFDLARKLGKPLMLFTQSLGPFREAENRRFVAAALRRAALILVRDELSKQHLIELGVPDASIRMAADAAFALDAGAVRTKATGRPLRVAVSVREWAYFKDGDRHEGMRRFMDAIAELIGHLVERHGAEVTFLSTCQGIAEYRYDDSAIAARIAEALLEATRGRVTVNREFHRPEELIRLLQGVDLLVATRMHMAILSLVAGTPVLPIAYEFKTRELFARLGMAEWVQDIDSVNGDDLSQSADRFIVELPALRKAVSGAALAERARALETATVVKEHWKGR